jgi:hypothetical protein
MSDTDIWNLYTLVENCNANEQLLYDMAAKYVADKNKYAIGRMLLNTNYFKKIKENLNFAIYLIKVCGAAACLENFEHFKIYADHIDKDERTDLINTFLSYNKIHYLIYRGINIDRIDTDKVENLLLMGHGILLNRHPQCVEYWYANLYKKRHDHILGIITLVIPISVLQSLVMEYVEYELG